MRLDSMHLQGIGQCVEVVHQGFSACDHGYFCRGVEYPLYNVVDGVAGMCIFIPTFFDIAPNTAYITSAQANKVSGFTLMKAFALDGVEMFHDR
jgi:hypothetical protein